MGVGVEGTGSYEAPLTRDLRRAGVEVLEVDRPNRQVRRRKGKTDMIDAIEAARAAQGQRQLGAAKTRDGNIEAIRALVVAKRSAKFSKIAALNQIRHLGFTAPEEIRQALQGLTAKMVARQAARMRPRAGGDSVIHATKTALRALGRRVLALDAETDSIHRLTTRREGWASVLAAGDNGGAVVETPAGGVEADRDAVNGPSEHPAPRSTNVDSGDQGDQRPVPGGQSRSGHAGSGMALPRNATRRSGRDLNRSNEP